MALTSNTGTATKEYDAFGRTRASSGSWQGPFGHAGGFGYQSDEVMGLQLLGHRYYDPETGRFLTRDPIQDGRNWYAYGAGETAPTAITDPTGLWSTLVFAPWPPPRPPGVNIEANIDFVRNGPIHSRLPYDIAWATGHNLLPDVASNPPAASAIQYAICPIEWVMLVRPGGKWDYKRINGRYEDFGNFNYGATGAALGFDLETLQRAGGFDQFLVGTNRSQDGLPWGNHPYGDDPKDAFQIGQGFLYYHMVHQRQ